jgi:hypothetical protein
MSECPIDAREYMYHAQERINACWQDVERIGMSEDLFRRLLRGWEETRLGLDYLQAALSNTPAEGEVQETEVLTNPEAQPVEAQVAEAVETPTLGSA